MTQRSPDFSFNQEIGFFKDGLNLLLLEEMFQLRSCCRHDFIGQLPFFEFDVFCPLFLGIGQELFKVLIIAAVDKCFCVFDKTFDCGVLDLLRCGGGCLFVLDNCVSR